MPGGGHGPPYLLFPKSFTPCTAWEGGLFAPISVRSGTTFHISQRVKLPTGASGSSTINTRLLASLGTPSIFNVGLMSLSSQVKRSGMFSPSLKSGLLSFIGASCGIFALAALVIRLSASIRTGSRVFIGPRILQSHDFSRLPSDKHLSPKG